MISKPIIPIWLMSIVCVIFIILILYHKQPNKEKNRKIGKQTRLNLLIKVAIVILLFVINLRFMLPDRETMEINSDKSVLFVIDTSVSMRALDYEKNKERWEGVVEDCCYIVDELEGCKFSIITFGDTAQKVIPFTTDSNMVQAELKAISLEDDFYAKGSSMNLSKELLEKTLKEEKQKRDEKAELILFFITDGEITKEGEKLESFKTMQQYVSDGAVLGYGTKTGGKMLSSNYEDEPNSSYAYVEYYDDDFNKKIAISKIDEKNLNQLASDMEIEYIHMSKTSNLENKLKDIKKQAWNAGKSAEEISSYQDIYYYFAIPLAVLLMADFIVQKRRML